MVRGTLSFISGGVRSGKSAFAEKQLTELVTPTNRLVYIASGQATDQEMQIRIRKHRKDRAAYHWQTIEQPSNFPQVLSSIQDGDCVLWDCMTTWLANELYAGWEVGAPCIHTPNCMARKEEELFQAIEEIVKRADAFVIVSNEVFHDLPSYDAETEIYRKWLGHLHQKVVRKADVAIEMEGGLPIYWKGESN